MCTGILVALHIQCLWSEIRSLNDFGHIRMKFCGIHLRALLWGSVSLQSCFHCKAKSRQTNCLQDLSKLFLLISLVYVNEIMRKIIPLVNINEMMWKIWEVVVEVIETQPTGPLNTLRRAFVGSKAAKSLTPCKPQGGALSVKPSCFFCWDWEGRCGAKHIDQHANFLTHALSFETERFWFDRLWKACGTLRPWTIA